MFQKLLNLYNLFSNKAVHTKNFSLLLIRLVLAYGFWSPAMMKWKNIDQIITWFSGMGIPFPQLNAYLSASTELAGSIFLTLGLMTRLISIPLMIVMLVAIFTVHLPNGFESGNNGFEIPLYYLVMLISLFANGSGKYSVDFFLKKIQKA